MGGGCVRREQGFVCVNIDAPRQPLGCVRNQFQGLRAEQVGALVTGRAQTKTEVIPDVTRRQGQQIEAVRNPLLQLAHMRKAKVLVKLGLSKQDDLHQLVVAGLKIG